MKKRIAELDFIKGIAIMLVVIGHVISQVWNNYPYFYENNIIFKFCYSFHMPLFVFVSGWISRLTIRNDIKWLIRRLKRLLIPYLIMVMAVFGFLRNGSFLLFLSDSPYWYLLFLIAADSLFYFGRRIKLDIAIFIPFYIVILFLLIRLPRNVGIIVQLINFLPFYAIGTMIPYLSVHINKLKITLLRAGSAAYVLLFPLYRLGVSAQIRHISSLAGRESLSLVLVLLIAFINKAVIPVCGIAMILFITKIIYAVKFTKPMRSAIELFGNHTLVIYLFHDLFFVRAAENSFANSIISLITAFFIPLILSLLFNHIRRKVLK